MTQQGSDVGQYDDTRHTWEPLLPQLGIVTQRQVSAATPTHESPFSPGAAPGAAPAAAAVRRTARARLRPVAGTVAAARRARPAIRLAVRAGLTRVARAVAAASRTTAAIRRTARAALPRIAGPVSAAARARAAIRLASGTRLVARARAVAARWSRSAAVPEGAGAEIQGAQNRHVVEQLQIEQLQLSEVLTERHAEHADVDLRSHSALGAGRCRHADRAVRRSHLRSAFGLQGGVDPAIHVEEQVRSDRSVEPQLQRGLEAARETHSATQREIRPPDASP